ncbi:putative secreted protein [Minicystis rosea]|nr:putative secreted protein [Minicystis rosea]
MESAAANAIVVLTQNAWGGAPLWSRRREKLSSAIAALAPDVIGLQEIHAPSPSGEESQAHEIADLLGGYQVIFAPGRVAPGGACEGVALLVRRGIEIVDQSVWKLSVDARDPLDAAHPRVVLRAALRRGVLFEALCTHLSLSRKARERTIRELLIFAAEERRGSRSEGAVLVGDFNAAPAEPALAHLEGPGGWVDVWDRANPQDSGATWPAAVPFRRIDYVWTQLGPGWKIAACERMPIAGSDHVGLWARLTFPRPSVL